MAETNFKVFINDLLYVINLPFKSSISSITNYNNLQKEKNKINAISNYYINFVYNLNDQLEQEKQLTEELKQQLEQERNLNENLKKKTICSICLENELSICCIPCGHTFCDKCVTVPDKCFICRSDIYRINRIYI